MLCTRFAFSLRHFLFIWAARSSAEQGSPCQRLIREPRSPSFVNKRPPAAPDDVDMARSIRSKVRGKGHLRMESPVISSTLF